MAKSQYMWGVFLALNIILTIINLSNKRYIEAFYGLNIAWLIVSIIMQNKNIFYLEKNCSSLRGSNFKLINELYNKEE